MLRKMLLVSPEYFKRLKEDAPGLPDIKSKQREHPYDRMVRLRELQDPILRKAQRLREPVSLSFVEPKQSPIRYKSRPKRSPQPVTYKTRPKHSPIRYKTKQRRRVKQPQRRLPSFLPDEYVAEPKVEEAEAEEEAAEDEAAAEGAAGQEAEEPEYYIPPDEMEELEERLQEKVGSTAGEYLSPYMKRSRYLDTAFGIRREDDGSFMIGNSPLTVDEESNVIIHGETFKGTAGLWELLTRKNVNKSLTTEKDLSMYKRILQLTNAHLENNQSFNKIKTTRGSKFKAVISQLFPPKKRGLPRWTSYK